MEQNFNIGAMKAEAIRKAFGIDIEKGRTGVYEDNAENRRLNRVGLSYGHKKEEEQKTVKTSKNTEQEQKTSAATMESAAQGASDEALKRASQDPNAPADVKAAAKKELENRTGGEEKKGEKKSETKSGEEIFNSFDKKKQKELLKIFQDETAQSGYDADEAVEAISEYLEGGDFTEAEDIAQNYGISYKEANNLVSHLLKLEIDRIKGKSGDVKKKGQTTSEYDAQKLENLSEDELLESAKKFGVKARLNRYGEIFLRIESKKEVKNLKKFLSSNGIEYDESKLSKHPGFYGTHSYEYDLYSGKQENSIGYYERKARYIQNDIDYLTNSSKNHPDERQRDAAKKELEDGSLKRELDEVKEKIASLKKTLK